MTDRGSAMHSAEIGMEQRSQAQVILFCLAWVSVHLLAAASLEVGGWGLQTSYPNRSVFWGTLLLVIQAPLLLLWLNSWRDAPGWLVSGGLLLGLTFFLIYPFVSGIFFSLCRWGLTPICVQVSLLVSLVPIGLLLGLIQWLLGRRHARRTAWLIPAQIAGMVAFAVMYTQLAFGPPSLAGAILPPGILAGLVYALVVALALPVLRPRTVRVRA